MSDLHRTEPRAAIQFAEYCGGKPGQMIVELRIGGGGKAAATVMPPSMHMTGEMVEWVADGEPAQVDGEVLKRSVAELAVAVLLTQHYPGAGSRHHAALAIGGALARAGWSAEAIAHVVKEAARAAGDDDVADRLDAARSALEAKANGRDVAGLTSLAKHWGEDVATTLRHWLGFARTTGAAPNGHVIQCGPDLTAMAEAAERALASSSSPLFRRDTQLVRPITLEARGVDDTPIKTVGLAPVSTILMRAYMGQAARFEKHDARQKAWSQCKPPADVAELVLARTEQWPFPPIRGVLAAPSLRPDGSLLNQPGYDAATGMYLFQPPPMPEIPPQPTMHQGQQALATLNNLLDGFPWQDDDNARAVGLSALISPVVRAALPTVPLHAISAPEAGTGKSYLTHLAAGIATGFSCPVTTTGKDDEECEKRLGASLLAGHVLLSLDNVSRPLGGDFLCQILDQPLVKVRILGQSGGPLIEPRIVLFANGNNLTLLGDIVRRAVVARMDAGQEDPWQRKFSGNPLACVLANRGKYIAAALTVCRAFLVSGESPAPPLPSFDGWSRIVRSALVWLGGGDPVKTITTAAAEDPERQNFAAVLAAWAHVFGSDPVSAAELITRANERNTSGDHTQNNLRDALLAVAASQNGEISSSKLGAWLRSHKDRVIHRHTLRRFSFGGGAHVAHWRVTEC